MWPENRSQGKSQPRVQVFIDASNIWPAQKAKGRLIDFAKLKAVLKKKFEASSVSINYYTAYPANGTRDYSLDGKHKFYTYLQKGLGIKVIKKELKVISTQSEAGISYIEKGNMDVEITIDAMHQIKNYDIAVLCSGDSDFLPLVTYLQNSGKKTYILSSKNNVSRELKTGGSGYIDILLIKEDIWGKNLKHREEKETA